MARTGGNPNLIDHQFTTTRNESLTAKFTLRVTPSMLSALQSLPNWREWVRDAISKQLEEEKNHK